MVELPKERLQERLDEAVQDLESYIEGLQDPIDDAIEALNALKEAYETDENPADTIQDLIQRLRQFE